MDVPVMQPRCPQCLTEHYALAVLGVSYGHPCPRCGHAKIYHDPEQYRADLRAAQQRHDRK